MKVLVACEYSGRVRDAFIRGGAEALSCDLLPTERPGPHYQGDVFDVLYAGWDLLIAFPPCTDLSNIGAPSWERKRMDGSQYAALSFVRRLADAPIAQVCIENPLGKLSSAWRKPDQIINPYQFGDPWKKRTCLWLRGLPKLTPTKVVEPQGHWVDGGSLFKKRQGNVMEGAYVASQQLPKIYSKGTHDYRAHARSKTFQGIADAMAAQWGEAT